MRKLVVGAGVALVVIAGGAYYGLVVYPDQKFRKSIDQAIAKLPPTYTLTYEGAHYAVVDKTATITGITLDNPAAPELHVTIEKIRIAEPSTDFADQWAKAKADPASVAPSLSLPLAREVEVTGITVTTPSFQGTVGSVHEKGLRVYPQALLQFDPIEFANLPLVTKDPQAPPDLAALRPILRAQAALIMGTAHDGYGIDDVAMKIHAPLPSGQPIEGILSVKRVEAKPFDRGVSDGGTTEGIAFSMGAQGGLRVERATVAGYDFSDAGVKLLAGAALDPGLLENLHIDGIRYEGLEAQSPATGVIKLGAIGVGKLQFTGGLPVSGSLGFEKLHLTRSQFTITGPNNPLDKLGLDAVTVSFGLGFIWNVEQQQIALSKTALKVEELGTIDMTGEINDAGQDMSNAVLAHATLTYTDGSLVNRAIGAIARQDKVEAAEARAQLVSMIQQQARALGKAPGVAAATQAVIAFLNQPKTLKVEMTPPLPMPFDAIRALQGVPPLAAFQALGVTVSANQ